MEAGYGIQKRIQVYVLVLLLVFLAAAFGNAGQVCDLTFTACPSKLPAGPLNVPMDVIGLDARIPFCTEMGKISGQASPSIMFVIDHSGSMRSTDPGNARYTVVNTLLDSIYAVAPSAKVGVAVFSDRLAFDYRDNPFFRSLFPGDATQHDSYIPLTSLDTVFGDRGRRGLDTLKALLKLDRSGFLFYGTAHDKERTPLGPLFSGGTDITLGFDAALAAMKKSTSPKESQYIIFLSDGEPSVMDDIRRDRQYAFVDGANTPTTYTVFFDPHSTVPPPIIVEMTDKIKANKYSTANPGSSVYTINLPGSQLQTILQQNVLSKILTPTTGKNVTVEITGGSKETTSTKSGTQNFLLSKGMPLHADLTPFRFSYAHTFRDSSFAPPLVRDTVFTYGVNVKRVAGSVLPAGVVKACREQADLGLFADGQGLAQIEAGQANLEARLTPLAGSTCANCTVEVTPSSGTDKETVPLTPIGSYLSASFTRAESVTPVSGNGKLEHPAADSIVLIWINPENPLDIVRKSYPYRMVPSSLGLFAEGKQVEVVTADHSVLEIRLTRPLGVNCPACAVQVQTTASADRELVPVKADGTAFKGNFIRLESAVPVAGDGKLQHLATDSLVLVWTNPDNLLEALRVSYPYSPIPPAIALFCKGKRLDSVVTGQDNLEIRLTLPSGEPCNACRVRVSATGGSDAETVVMGGGASPYRGAFTRSVSSVIVPGDGKLQHLAKDSIVLYYENTLSPSQNIRKSYPYVDFNNIVCIEPQNDIARIAGAQVPTGGRQWIISDAPGLQVKIIAGGGSCCLVMPMPVNALSRDSLGTVGIIVAAPRGFRLDVKVFSTLGQFVNEASFIVPDAEFTKLSPVPGKDKRFLRLLWRGQSRTGAFAANGAYVLTTTIKLLPLPGLSEDTAPTTSIRRVGVLRGNI